MKLYHKGSNSKLAKITIDFENDKIVVVGCKWLAKKQKKIVNRFKDKTYKPDEDGENPNVIFLGGIQRITKEFKEGIEKLCQED